MYSWLEVIGFPGNGRTEFAMQCAQDLLLKDDRNVVYYLDCDETLDADRFPIMNDVERADYDGDDDDDDGADADEREYQLKSGEEGSSYKQIAKHRKQRFHYFPVSSDAQLVALIVHKIESHLILSSKNHPESPLQLLLVIDNVGKHFIASNFKSAKKDTMASCLTGLGRRLHSLSCRYRNLLILTTNQYTKDGSGMIIPSLGVTWSVFPSQRLLLSWMQGKRHGQWEDDSEFFQMMKSDGYEE